MTAAYRTRHERNATLATHRHREPYAALVLDGDYTEASLDGPLPCAPGTLVLHPAFHAHGDRFGRSGASAINLELSPAATPGVTADPAFAARAWCVHDLNEAREVFERAPRRLAELLACAQPLPAAALPDWQGELLRRMNQDEREIAELARELGVSAEHASRALGRSFGMSPRALRREARWRRALRLLAAPMALADVAAAAGFADQSHLHKVVVAHAGCTPLQLRRQVLAPAECRVEAKIKCVQDPHAARAA
ncbi:transcriptional regulator, AraC family [Lysobacter enzymogenes]|uniref:Transcriptional regulator, AraC family n=1 Tax=Lysobacter enzymogenes TaxID=69 RepID=A0A0S2DJ85_LYSEN|nr:helix-turn-helix domain-containing protein [Lysobacter enzymogenes]ALN58465.1 transcriptional regulator, AraC family [Lysobacter enzymogenes]